MDLSSRTRTGWYARPVLFVADVKRALRFCVDVLGLGNSGATAI